METRKEAGQALTEFAAATLLLIPVFVACFGLFHAEWNRERCAYLVFEAAHARLTQGSLPFPARGITCSEGRDSVRGEGICGEARETVELPRLESARW